MVPRSRIIATFWEDLPESDGRRALTTTLGRLRRSLPEWPVLSEGDLLGWDLDGAIAVDTSLLTRLAKEAGNGTEPLHATDVKPLWRGPFLQDFYLTDAPAFDQWLYAQRQHWEEQFLDVVSRLIATESSNGAWDSIASHARQALQVNPLQERFHRVLMAALYLAGDRTAALAQYTALQQYLQADLGVEPDQSTTRLRDAILANNVGLIGSETGRSVLVQSPAHPQHSHLPAPSTRFIGRESDIATLKAAFPKTRLLTLTGAGGVGKTRLALQVAADLLPARPDGVWFVDLASLTEPDLVPAVVATTLGLRERPDRTPLEALVSHLKGKQALLVLDNCEHLIQACAGLADTLLRGCPELCVMATSREALRIPAERAWPVPPLRLPEPERMPPFERLQEYDAIQLFTDRAAAVVPHFAVTAANAPIIARICHRLDGIPLAIELAATLVKVLSVDEINTRLGDRFRLLQMGSRTASARQQTLRGAVDWSYDLLSAAEQAFLQRLSVFAGGFTLDAAEAVCAGTEIPREQVLNLLHRLVDKSLVIAGEHGGERFRLLETIRQYGLEKLREAAEETAVRERHADWCLGLAEEVAAQQWGPEWIAGYDRLEREHDNLRAALEWSLPAKAVRLAWALLYFWDTRGHVQEGRRWVAALLAAADPSLEPPLRAAALTLSSFLAAFHLDYRTAIPPAEQALALWRELGDRKGLARCLLVLGLALHHSGAADRAVPLLEEAVGLLRTAEDGHFLRHGLYYLAEALVSLGDYRRARAMHEESLALRRLANDRNMFMSLIRLARIAALEKDQARAEALLREAAPLWNSHFRRGIATCLEDLAFVALSGGQAERAVCLVGAAAAIRGDLGLTAVLSCPADREQVLTAARSRLSEQAFEAAWCRGQALSPEQALAYALDHQSATDAGVRK